MTEKFIETVGYVIDEELKVACSFKFEGEERFGVLAIKKGDRYFRRLTEAKLKTTTSRNFGTESTQILQELQ